MKIILPGSIIRIFSGKTFKSILKVLEVRNNSTLIDIKGHQIDVPFILKKGSKYQAVINNGKIEIVEIKIKDFKNIEKITPKEMLESLIQIDDKKNDLIAFLQLFIKNFIKSPESNKKNNYFFKDKKNGYIFIFDVELYNAETKVFIKINEQSMKMFFYNSTLDRAVKDKFKAEMAQYLQKKYLDYRFEIMFFDKKKNFYDNITIYTTEIDMKI